MSTGVELPYEKLAIEEAELPDGLRYPDQLLFLALRNLYKARRLGAITTDMGRVEKKKLLDEYRCYQFQWEMGDEWVKRIKETDLARAEFKKNPTLENAWEIVRILEGMKHET